MRASPTTCRSRSCPLPKARELIDINVTAPLLLARAVLPGMLARDSGAIINVASLLAFSGSCDRARRRRSARFTPRPRLSSVTHTQVLAGELAGTGVRVHAACPARARSEFPFPTGPGSQRRAPVWNRSWWSAPAWPTSKVVVISIPALPDESALTRYNEAAAALTAVARATELPDRYAEAHP